MMKNLRRNLLPEKRKQQKLQLTIAILFSLLTIFAGFSQILYVPIEGSKILDITIVGFVFAVLIGGYGVGIPLAIVWSLITWLNIPEEFRKWDLWQMVLVREVFAISLVFFYELARKIFKGSPYNVYIAIVISITVKFLVGLPFEMMARGVLTGLQIRVETAILEMALCSIFMKLLIKHLRQIHILNGIRKKGEKKHGN